MFTTDAIETLTLSNQEYRIEGRNIVCRHSACIDPHR